MLEASSASRAEGGSPARDAVGALLAAHRGELLGFVNKRAGRHLSPEDVVQQVAARALAGSEQLRDHEAGRAWLFTITRRVMAEQLRRVQPTALSLQEDAAATSPAEPFACSCVLANVEHLKSEYAEILARVVIQGVAITDVAAELGISVNAATVRVHRAREALKARLLSHCGTDSLRACLGCSCLERGCCG